MATATQLIKLAASQIGVKEEPSGSNKVKYWDYYKAHSGLNLNGSPWCAAFVTWCLSETGVWNFTHDEGRFRYCPDTVNWAKRNGFWVERDQGARAGDVVIFGNNGVACHIGIVEKVNSPTQIQTIEGNTSLTSNDNGGAVMRRTRDYGTKGSKWYVMGFIRNPLDIWYQDNGGWWLQYASGGYPASKWLKLDTWYWFDKKGYAVTGWNKINKRWYFFDANCHMLTGWYKGQKYWYYLNKADEGTEGAMRTGWFRKDGFWYYLQPTQTTTWPEGSAHTGWVTDKGKKYYLRKKSDGGTECSMVTGKFTIDGKVYEFDSSGALVS